MKWAPALLAVCCCLSAASGQWQETKTQPAASRLPQFNTQDVSQRVRIHRSTACPSVPSAPAFGDGEFLIDTSGVGEQWSPAAAFDGANYLVVWQDYRTGSNDIRGARVSSDGAMLDSAGFVVSQASKGQCVPVVGFGGASFLVVWEDYRSGSGDIYGARVTPQGAVLDTQGIFISHALNDAPRPAVSFDGMNFLVVWKDRRNGDYGDIYGARVTPTGVVLDPAGVPISTGEDWQAEPFAAFDSKNFLVVWEVDLADWTISGARVTPQGEVLDTEGVVISQGMGAYLPVVGFDGSNSLVVWRSPNGYTYGARVTPQGTVLDSAGLLVSHGAGNQHVPAVGFDGTNFLVVWQDDRSGDWDVYGAHVTPGGTVLHDGAVVSYAEEQSHPALGCGNGGRTLLVYQGWAGNVGGKPYNTVRIWGKMDPNPGVEETMNDERGTMHVAASIVGGKLFLPEASSRKPQATSLLDISGRKVMDLKPGANDVRHLAPGVYFVRAVSRELSAVSCRKVVVTR
jgi:hypothetical protein